MATPLDTFEYLYRNAQRAIEGEEAHEKRMAELDEKRKLDEEYQYERKQQRAIDERNITLHMATAASILMTAANTQYQDWQYDAPKYETKGWLRKREVQVGTHRQIALEGWELTLPQNQSSDLYFQPVGRQQLVLRRDDPTDKRPHLVWFERPSGINGPSDITKHDVRPLSSTPLSSNDMMWAHPRPKEPDYIFRESINGNSAHLVIQPETDKAEMDRLQALLDNNEATGHSRIDVFLKLSGMKIREKADYDTYRKARMEKKIQQAIAHVAAKRGLLDLN